MAERSHDGECPGAAECDNRARDDRRRRMVLRPGESRCGERRRGANRGSSPRQAGGSRSWGMSDNEGQRKFREFYGSKRFDVESGLNMYATSFFTLPASAIYESNILKAHETLIQNCHIYLIGLLPTIDVVDCVQEGLDLVTCFHVAGKQHDLRWPLSPGLSLKGDGKNGWHVVDANGTKIFPAEDVMMARLKAEAHIDFKVLYIGQAFGEDGSRNALDRLLKHETLQKIAVKGIPQEYVLSLLLLEIIPVTRMIMMFNGVAKDRTQSEERIKNAFDKLENTSEAERTTLYEASLIRYFVPPYNKEFKNIFPSANMKLLADCYDKDIAAVSAEIVFDNLPFRLCSDTIEARDYHIAHHDLHSEEDRKVFFLDAPPTKDR
jgi:hypothetical protein